MVCCPGCGSKDVTEKGGSDKQTYQHPTAQGVIERFVMILCNKCNWSWNIAGAKNNAG